MPLRVLCLAVRLREEHRLAKEPPFKDKETTCINAMVVSVTYDVEGRWCLKCCGLDDFWELCAFGAGFETELGGEFLHCSNFCC